MVVPRTQFNILPHHIVVDKFKEFINFLQPKVFCHKKSEKHNLIFSPRWDSQALSIPLSLPPVSNWALTQVGRNFHTELSNISNASNFSIVNYNHCSAAIEFEFRPLTRYELLRSFPWFDSRFKAWSTCPNRNVRQNYRLVDIEG